MDSNQSSPNNRLPRSYNNSFVSALDFFRSRDPDFSPESSSVNFNFYACCHKHGFSSLNDSSCIREPVLVGSQEKDVPLKSALTIRLEEMAAKLKKSNEVLLEKKTRLENFNKDLDAHLLATALEISKLERLKEEHFKKSMDETEDKEMEYAIYHYYISEIYVKYNHRDSYFKMKLENEKEIGKIRKVVADNEAFEERIKKQLNNGA